MRFDSLSDWLAWQEQLHPKDIELGLARVCEVWSRLSNREFSCPVITVAGTNGKGSCVAMLQAIYRQAGYRVGSYTSPHLWRYNERVCIDAEPVTDEVLCAAFDRIETARDNISLTYFEFGTLAALDIFLREPLDVVILEVGLGGRLDAVNIIDADVALITSIDLDHQQWLGPDRESIAREKAGILRPHNFGILADPDAPISLLEHAKAIGNNLFCLGRDFAARREDGSWNWQAGQTRRVGLPIPALAGAHQLDNAAGVLMAIETLLPRLPVSQAEIRQGLLHASVPGRFHIRPGKVTQILDVAHNPAAARALAKNLRQVVAGGRVHAVFAALADKDIAGLVEPLCACVTQWYIAPLTVPRAATCDTMVAALHARCPDAVVETFADLEMAWRAAMQAAQAGDTVLVFGSFYTVARVGQERL